MSGLNILGVIAAVWVFTFLILLLPGRWLGSWVVKHTPNTFVGILFCIAFAKLFVAYLAVVLVFARLPFLPHVNTDAGFAIAFTALMFFVPAFVAQFMGFRRAQARAKPTGIPVN
ncbi:hypothetical protein [Bradyrhizobium retamae]|uniref:Uncharacterized protein n=1 Tax=Bradyrhizobium retamae TaxID=1300035 RepID=A0A0R3MM24_9BRAD|nr:hypothetical protein [Bradyrhizobium retamae]KRR21225.1 hypothetical protein CQ13_30945 [Bradyrhizobium retamae]